MYSERKIIHIDMDAFFASVEQLDTPSLQGLPLIVGGDPHGRGVVAACSYEARRFGVCSAMVCSKALRLCPQAVFVKPRMERYKEVSVRVMKILYQYTDLVEPLSLDEAFLDITNNKKDIPSATWVAEAIRKQIFKETGLTASAGVSCNKFLAKVASDLNKPNGLKVITPQEALEFVGALPVKKFFGVGRVTEEKMRLMGIHNGADLRKHSRIDLIQHFGKPGSFFYDIVRGIDHRPVNPSRQRKSIGAETTLAKDIVDRQAILDILLDLAGKVEERLQKNEAGGHNITLKVRFSDFTTVTRSQTKRIPMYSAREIISCISQLLDSTEIEKKKERLLGITISKLTRRQDRKYFLHKQLELPFGTN